uniref:Uncharacterized protein n=1 Tax=Cacopsylla melanoneura TaxID=428564 RepID=A0A8D9FAN1_9HEMI
MFLSNQQRFLNSLATSSRAHLLLNPNPVGSKLESTYFAIYQIKTLPYGLLLFCRVHTSVMLSVMSSLRNQRSVSTVTPTSAYFHNVPVIKAQFFFFSRPKQPSFGI